jgi:hypothetical protein
MRKLPASESYVPLEPRYGIKLRSASYACTRDSGTQAMLSRFLLNSLAVDGPGNIYAMTYTFPNPTTGAPPYYMLRFPVGATGNVAPTAALLSVTGVGLGTH